MNRKISRQLSAVSVLLLGVMGALVGQPASGSEPEPALVSDTSAPRERTTRLLLHHPVSLPDAVEASGKLRVEVVGFRYLNFGIEGEYFPSSSYPLKAFLHDFSHAFGAEPSVVALVVRANSTEPELQTLEAFNRFAPSSGGEQLNLLPEFLPRPPVGGATWEAAARLESFAVAEASRERSEDRSLTSTEDVEVSRAVNDFHPGYSQISLTTGAQGQALIDTQHVWVAGRETSTATPDYWGLEFKIDLINQRIRNTNPDDVRLDPVFPYCTAYPDVEDRFWAKNYGYSWSVYQVGATKRDYYRSIRRR